MFYWRPSLMNRKIPPFLSKIKVASLIIKNIHQMAAKIATDLQNSDYNIESFFILTTKFADSAKSEPKQFTLYSNLRLRYASSK